ncbi:MAG: GAF domain-containing protein [Ardenticatenaceae bacterium]|nr:GAF domain-containing protein [Ardenticatenaceae bacterium]
MLLDWTFTPYTIPLFVAAAISGLLFFPAQRRLNSPGAKAFAWFSALAALWCLGYALEIGATTLPAKLFWVKIQYVGIVNVSSVFIVFCLQYTRRWRFPSRWLVIFFVIPWLLLLTVWLEPGLGIFYRAVGLKTTDPFINLDVTYGPLFWVLIAYSYSMLLAGSYLLLTLGHKLRDPYRLQTYGLVLATIFPWLGNGLYVTRLTPFPALDLTPLGFAATAIFLAWNLRKLSLLDVAPFARETVLENMSNVMLVWNEQHRLLDFNPSAERLFNSVSPLKVSMTAQELFQGPFANVLPLYEQNEVQQEIKLSWENNSGFFEATVSPLRDQRGQPSGRLLILHDVTEARQAAQELENQKQLFETLVEIAHVVTQTPELDETLQSTLSIAVDTTAADTGSLFLFDEDQNITHRILAWPNIDPELQVVVETAVLKKGLAGWVLQHKQSACVHDTTSDARWLNLGGQPYIVRSALAVPVLRKGSVLGILTLTHPNTNHFTEEKIQLMQLAADQISLAFTNAQMYAAEQRLVEELSVAKDQAEAASRSKSAFLANMSHELRTPLTAIIGYNELLQEVMSAQDTGTHLLPYLQKSETAAYHLLAIISEILDMSKIEAGKVILHIEEVEIEELLQKVVTVAQPLMSPNSNHFTVNCPPDIGSMHTDPTLLNQVLLNLLGNAAKFTENGQVELHISRQDQYVQFKVCDTGIGLTEEQIAGLFQPFTQADSSLSRKFGGTGLGLSISQHYCQMLGGEICVESQFGQGSIFTVNLPWRARNLAK